MAEGSNPILVVGASGRFAGLVAAALAAKGHKVRGLVRDELAADRARANGASEVAIGELRDPTSLDEALRNVRGVFHIGPAFLPDEARLGVNLVEAAERARVDKIVFSSVIQPTFTRLSNHASKIPVEEAIFASGIDYTILRPTNLFQNLRGAWPGIVATGVFAEPSTKTARIARVDYRDVAEAAAAAFDGQRLSYGAFDLCGDGSPNRVEIAALISQVLGRTIVATQCTFEEWAAAAKLPYDEPQKRALKAVHDHYSASGSAGNSLVLRAVLGREPRTLRAYIEELAAEHPAT